MKKLLYLLLMSATISAPAYGMAGRFGAFKNLYSRFTAKTAPISARLFTPKKLAVATGLTLGTGAAVYAYQNPDKVIQKIGMEPSYKALGYIDKKSWLTNHYAKNIAKVDIVTFEETLKQDPEAIHILTQAAAQNIDKTDHSILHQIINKNPQAAQIFTQPAALHFDQIDADILIRILDKNPAAAQFFTQPAAQHITTVNPLVFMNILKQNPEAAKVFTQPAAQHIDKVNAHILRQIMSQNPEAAQIFTEPIALHLDQIPTDILKSILDKNPQAYLQFFLCSAAIQEAVHCEIKQPRGISHFSNIFSSKIFLKNFVIKKELDRLFGAKILNDVIEKNNLDLLFVPHKCACVLDGDIKTVATKLSNLSNKPFNLAQIRQLYVLFKRTNYWDIKAGNIIQTTDGRVAIIDTEMRGFATNEINFAPMMWWYLRTEPAAREYLEKKIIKQMSKNSRAWYVIR